MENYIKQCRLCREFLDSSEFYKAKRYKDGLRNECRKCCYKLDRQRAAAWGNKKILWK